MTHRRAPGRGLTRGLRRPGESAALVILRLDRPETDRGCPQAGASSSKSPGERYVNASAIHHPCNHRSGRFAARRLSGLRRGLLQLRLIRLRIIHVRLGQLVQQLVRQRQSRALRLRRLLVAVLHDEPGELRPRMCLRPRQRTLQLTRGLTGTEQAIRGTGAAGDALAQGCAEPASGVRREPAVRARPLQGAGPAGRLSGLARRHQSSLTASDGLKPAARIAGGMAATEATASTTRAAVP